MPAPDLSLRDVASLQRENGPLDAFLIGAGAATDGVMDQAKRAYLLARLGLAGRWQGPEAEQVYRAKLAALAADRGENARLYQPLKAAYPFTVGAGEALPAFVAGRGQGMNILKFDTGRTALDQAGALSFLEANYPNAGMTLRDIAGRLRNY